MSKERICTSCGRAARVEARFCQCGVSLVRLCYWCYDEVPCEYQRCDTCGWLDPGVGITPAIEGAWRTFISLVEHKSLNQVDPFLTLFYSIWRDARYSSSYHERTISILELIKGKMQFWASSYSALLRDLFHVRPKETIDYIVQQSRHDPNAVVFLEHVVRKSEFSNDVEFRRLAVEALLLVESSGNNPAAPRATEALEWMLRDLDDASWAPIVYRSAVERLVRSPHPSVAKLAKAAVRRFDKRWV
jgi:hypothetical protein